LKKLPRKKAPGNGPAKRAEAVRSILRHAGTVHRKANSEERSVLARETDGTGKKFLKKALENRESRLWFQGATKFPEEPSAPSEGEREIEPGPKEEFFKARSHGIP